MKTYFIDAEINTSYCGNTECKKFNDIIELEDATKIKPFIENHFGVTGYFSSVQWHIRYNNIQLL